MSSDEFRFMLWERTPEGTWKLHCRSKTRGPVEKEVMRVPVNTIWRFVSQHEGVLAESVARA